MELINQKVKKLMEKCKEKAYDSGLRFGDETLEYMVTNRDMIKLSPKVFIPTMYDFWIHDVDTISGQKEYEIYPHNAYETVINSAPALSFYNTDNPDWLNCMIFYHVLAHIDFFKNNIYFSHTWGDDFVGQALADKRLLQTLRSKHGRWVDYTLEFGRSIDNIVNYYNHLSDSNSNPLSKIDFFFDVFIQNKKYHVLEVTEYFNYINKYNELKNAKIVNPEGTFIGELKEKFPEFDTLYQKYKNEWKAKPNDLLQYIINESPFINKDENKWMKDVLHIVRNTSLYFSPQMRTKIMNEGWASYWHDKLFMEDEHLQTHETDYAVINAKVTSLPKVGMNPYALGLRLFQHIEDNANKGKLSYDFEKIHDINKRKAYNKNTNKGNEFIFKVRKEMNDFTFINKFIDQDFCDKHSLMVVGERINLLDMVKEYYVKSKKAEDFKSMVVDSLVHPPKIEVDDHHESTCLNLIHKYEGKQLIEEFIEPVLVGIEYLWNGKNNSVTNTVRLTTKRHTSFGEDWKMYSIKNGKIIKV